MFGGSPMKRIALTVALALAVASSSALYSLAVPAQQGAQLHPKETYLRNIRQITFGGENAEAYFSPDGRQLIFQSTREPYKCDQIFTMNVDGTNLKMVSTGTGRTTCGYFTPDGRVIYAS